MRRWMLVLTLFGLGIVLGMEQPAAAQFQDQRLNQFYHYPYYYFPHNYWPQMSPRWPEPVGMPYRPPPAYQAYPPFLEPNWRYEMFQPQKYYRGFHNWLDHF